jgi:FKBP-type peptidyl-prolyl cis-trans isomerase FkpA
VLKYVNKRVLFFKKVNLPIINKVMNRLILLCWCLLLFTACKKADNPTVINSEQAAIDDKIIADYVAANGLTGTAIKADTSGVYYIQVKQGPVNTLYSLSSRITVAFTGRELTTGSVFAAPQEFHPSYRLGETITGWQIGIIKGKVNKGGIIRLLIPSRHAYGPNKQPNLGLDANAVLDFTIQIFDVTN